MTREMQMPPFVSRFPASQAPESNITRGKNKPLKMQNLLHVHESKKTHKAPHVTPESSSEYPTGYHENHNTSTIPPFVR